MLLLEGRPVAEKILKKLRTEIRKRKISPGLAVVLIGKNKASNLYVGLKEKAAKKVGIAFFRFDLSKDISEKEIVDLIEKLNADPKIHGIIVQLPLPKNFNTEKIIGTITPTKDADGFLKTSPRHPVFPSAIVRLLESGKTRLNGKKAMVIANSEKFGQTMAEMLREKGLEAEYILAKNLSAEEKRIKRAEVIVTAMGKAGAIKGVMVRRGTVVIDGGISKKGKKVFGDVDFASLRKKATQISPVPGGVGPVTVACLLQNTYLNSIE